MWYSFRAVLPTPFNPRYMTHQMESFWWVKTCGYVHRLHNNWLLLSSSLLHPSLSPFYQLRGQEFQNPVILPFKNWTNKIILQAQVLFGDHVFKFQVCFLYVLYFCSEEHYRMVAFITAKLQCYSIKLCNWIKLLISSHIPVTSYFLSVTWCQEHIKCHSFMAFEDGFWSTGSLFNFAFCALTNTRFQW